MAKDDRIQVRVDSERKLWLLRYAKSKKLTVSKMFIDFIDWLRHREEAKSDEP